MKNQKCRVCNSLNDEEDIYCKKCGAFLYGNDEEQHGEKIIKTIWEIEMEQEQKDSSPAKDVISDETPQKMKSVSESGHNSISEERWILKCPACYAVYKIENKQKPLFCTFCNYFFQDSDQPVLVDENTSTKKNDEKEADVVSKQDKKENTTVKESPIPKRMKKKTKLRIICLTQQMPFLAEVPEAGGIFGKNGNIHPELFGKGVFRNIKPQHFMIWYAQSGWYIRALNGTTFLNGDEMNLGVSRRLFDGDTFLAGNCSFRVEITECI